MYVLTLAVCLVSASAQPLFIPAGATAAFTAAGGLTVTSAAGATLLSVPTVALVAGKVAVAGKLLLLKAYLDERNKNQKANKRG